MRYQSGHSVVRCTLAAVVFLCCLGLATGCSTIRNVKNIKILGGSVSQVTPLGLHGLKAVLDLKVENPAMQLGLSDVTGVVRYKGEPIVNLQAEPVVVNGRTTAVYSLPCSANLSEGLSLMKVVGMLSDYNMDDLKIDLTLRLKLKSGLSAPLKFKNISVSKMLK